VKDENGDMLADFHNILNRWKNCLSQLMNVYKISDVRQIEVHTAKPLVIKKKKLHGLSPRANYTDRATAASRRSVANLCG
jgi:hypothetical protein